MALSYEYSIGSVRAREKNLLTHTDMEQLLACKNEEEAAAMLSDKGYGEGKTVEEILSSHTAELWKYLKATAPDFGIFKPFLMQNDVHNYKVILKGTMVDREYGQLLLSPSTVEIPVMKKAIESRLMHLLPEWLRVNADKAYEALAHTGDARLADAYVDKAAMLEMLRLCDAGDSAFLNTYLKTYVFYCNIKTVIRSARTGANREYLKRALVRREGFRKDALIAAAMKGYEPLIDELSKIPDYDCKKAMEAYKQAPSAFERWVDDRLTVLTKESCKRAGEGAEPLLGYYLGSEVEKKVIHIIVSGIRTKSGVDTIRERLREIYG
ncbi:MAG: V-type ATPase subunit [Ruminococcus sp.]|nr:V-type ATPase subunit [Ruminococcus sp.]